MTGPVRWSYQPSVSSQAMITAVSCQSSDCCGALSGRDGEGLRRQRIGIARMGVLIGRGLDEGDGRQAVRLKRRVEVGHVVLMVGPAGMTDLRDRGGRR